MRLLLDTHALIWALDTPERLPTRVQTLFGQPGVTVLTSSVSTWEISIKAALGRLKLPLPDLPRALLAARFRELPVRIAHALATAQLPRIHHDPFDRLLIAQARHEHLTLVTRDRAIQRYPVATLWD